MLNVTEWDIQRVWNVIGDLQMRVTRLEKERGGEQSPRPTSWAIIRQSYSRDATDVFCGEHGFVAISDCNLNPTPGEIALIPTWFPFDDDDPATVIRLLGLNGARVALLYRDTLEEVELR